MDRLRGLLIICSSLALLLLSCGEAGVGELNGQDQIVLSQAAQPHILNVASSTEYPDIQLSFVGDLMAHPPNFRMTDYGRIYEAVEHIFHEDDLSFANLEFVVDPGREMAGFPQFNVHPEYVLAAIDAGFDVFSLANNHTNDYGLAGVQATREQMGLLVRQTEEESRRQIYVSGLKTNGEIELTEIQYRGWNIAFLSVTAFSNRYDSGIDEIQHVAFWSAAENEALLDYVRQAHSMYDLFILSYHGGTEYQLEPSPEKWRYFNQLMDAGVDILWGHHPHVLQPIEFYSRPDGRQGLVMYSMGNFISSQPWYLGPDDAMRRRAYTGDSVITRVQLEMTSDGASVRALDLYPITHLMHFEESHADRDGFEVHPSSEVVHVASSPWKDFYRTRQSALKALLGPASARHFRKTHPLP